VIPLNTKPYSLLVDDGSDTSIYIVGGNDEHGAVQNFLRLYGEVHADSQMVRVLGVCQTFEDPEDST